MERFKKLSSQLGKKPKFGQVMKSSVIDILKKRRNKKEKPKNTTVIP